MKNIVSCWNSYKHRFLPWILFNWATRTVDIKNSPTEFTKNGIKQSIASQLIEYLKLLSFNLPSTYLNGSENQISNYLLQNEGQNAMREIFGFTVEKRSSTNLIGQDGVFVSNDITKHQLVALYPGTIYLPMEPLLLVSIANSYLLRCYDGIYIDGKNKGLSRYIYKSCAYRDKIGNSLCADLSWLSNNLVNPLNIGQYINNQSCMFDANVEYCELDIPMTELTIEMRRLLPYVYWSSINSVNNISKLRTICVLSTRKISAGEELYSNYFTVIKSNH